MPQRLLLLLALLLPACAPSLGDDDDAVGDDDDSTGDDDDSTGDDDDSTGDDDDSSMDADGDGWTAESGDCDDADPSVNPGAWEDPANGRDDDCDGDVDEVDDWGCVEVFSPLRADQVSPLGYSALDVLGPIEGPLSATGTYSATSATTTVNVSLALDGEPVFIDRSYPPEPPPWGPEPICDDALSIPVVIGFSTADNAFAERISASVYVGESSPDPSLWAALAWDTLGGDFDLTTMIDPAEWDAVSMDLSVSWSGPMVSGQVSMIASRTNPNGVGEAMVGPILLF